MFHVLITELKVVKLVFSTSVPVGCLGIHLLLFTLLKVVKVYLYIFIKNVESILLEKVYPYIYCCWYFIDKIS